MAQTKAREQIEDRNLQKHPVLSVPWILRISPEAVKLELGRKKQITRGKERDGQTARQLTLGSTWNPEAWVYIWVFNLDNCVLPLYAKEPWSVGLSSGPLQPPHFLLLSQLLSAVREASVGFPSRIQGHW